MVTNKLLEYHDSHFHFKKKPRHIILYRTNVPEGDHVTLAREELSALRRATQGMKNWGHYTPNIVYILCTVDHGTKVLRDGCTHSLPAGTVVHTNTGRYHQFHDEQHNEIHDKHHNELHNEFYNKHNEPHNEPHHKPYHEFYLSSGHPQKRQPTQYRVMTNDSDLPLAHLEHITNALCYLHARGTYHDTLPAPARHALLAAQCSRAMIEHTKELDDTCKTVFAVDRATAVDYDNPMNSSLYYI